MQRVLAWSRAVLVDGGLLLSVAAGPEVQSWHRACGGVQGAGFSERVHN
jgi:hypothetical protein